MTPRHTARGASEAGLFYGWRIVGVSFLTLFFTVGFGFYSFGAFFKVLGEDLGGSRFGVAAVNTLYQGVIALLAPFLGREIDRRSVRSIMAVGSVLLAIGFALAAWAGTLWHIYLVFGTVLAIGAAMVGQLPATTLVANWFVARRGMALGIATMGISLSGVIMAPVATALISWVGWRGTFLIYGAVTLLVVTPCVLWVVVNEPEDLGLRPDGRAGPQRRPQRRLRRPRRHLADRPREHESSSGSATSGSSG